MQINILILLIQYIKFFKTKSIHTTKQENKKFNKIKHPLLLQKGVFCISKKMCLINEIQCSVVCCSKWSVGSCTAASQHP